MRLWAIVGECVRRASRAHRESRLLSFEFSGCQKAGAEDGCACPPRGCLRWREGGARPPLTPTHIGRSNTILTSEGVKMKKSGLRKHTKVKR